MRVCPWITTAVFVPIDLTITDWAIGRQIPERKGNGRHTYGRARGRDKHSPDGIGEDVSCATEKVVSLSLGKI